MQVDHLYWIQRWSEGYFTINSNGHVSVKPDRSEKQGDLYNLVRSLVEQGVEPPILIRFNHILRDRIKMLSEAFRSAIEEFDYRASHHIAYPIKVNPQRHVVEMIQQEGQKYQMGLEVGSKPELIAVLALGSNEEALLLCNGYKDEEYISIALMSRKLGRRTIIIVEQAYELRLVLQTAEKLGVEAEIGFRMKLSNKGSGRWKTSGGEHSKFGLFSYEIVKSLQILKEHNKSNWLKLLHFHIGSQITNIDSIKKALNEGTRVFTEIAKDHPSLSMLDVGGGLAVDYDGTRSLGDSSMNYTVKEYARDVVFSIKEACENEGIPHPTIITESGRAITSHHAVFITEVLDVTSSRHMSFVNPPSDHEIIRALLESEAELSIENCREVFHDAMDIKEKILEQFLHQNMTLEERAFAEAKFRELLEQIRVTFRQLPDIPDEIEELNEILLEKYFCNFSVFQSLPDSWAIGQLFPIMPIHRLNEEANHQAVIADLSCDSDGKIDQFIGRRHPSSNIRLHTYTEEPYYIGIFLVGAYQEILGCLHNLFGDANVVHAELDDEGSWELSRLVEGDTIEEVLRYVQYDIDSLKNQLNTKIESSLKKGAITNAEAAEVKKTFRKALESFTYLVV